MKWFAHPGTDPVAAKCMLAHRLSIADEEQLLVLGADALLSSASLALQSDGRLPLEQAEIRAWRDDSGEADVLSRVGDDAAKTTGPDAQPTTKAERFELTSMLSGGATIEHAVLGVGWHSLGHYVLAGAPGLQLGPIVLDAPAQFDVKSDEAWKRELTLGLRGQGLNIESYARSVSANASTFLFPAGDYELCIERSLVVDTAAEIAAKIVDGGTQQETPSTAKHVSRRAVHSKSGEAVELDFTKH